MPLQGRIEKDRDGKKVKVFDDYQHFHFCMRNEQYNEEKHPFKSDPESVEDLEPFVHYLLKYDYGVDIESVEYFRLLKSDFYICIRRFKDGTDQPLNMEGKMWRKATFETKHIESHTILYHSKHAINYLEKQIPKLKFNP